MLPTTKTIKIAIVGPESTGKSTVAHQLAAQKKSLCVPEYARYYCQNLNNNYSLQDEINMFYGQIALEEAMLESSTNHILFCDTTILTVKIWSDHLFGHTPTEVTDEIKRRTYDLYLLMDIDLPWQDDPLRDFPDQREHFMQIWIQELKALSAEYKIISGQGEDRFANALKATNDFL
ncbi:ATP-binding protein [Sphingobacterium shayense]|nr:ATP-binding protein [Sphingobacterium shayense]